MQTNGEIQGGNGQERAARAGAADLHVNNTTAIHAERTDRFLRQMGFRQTGGNDVLEGLG
jgi:hypothetical protein